MAYHMYIMYTIVDTVYAYVMDICKRIKRELGKYPCFHIRPPKTFKLQPRSIIILLLELFVEHQSFSRVCAYCSMTHWLTA